MNGLIAQHLGRAFRKHWALQMASITVMSLVLVILNLIFLGFTAFHRTLDQWGQGLEMTVYVKEGVANEEIEKLRSKIELSRDFELIKFTAKSEATKNFLSALGGDSLALLSDPKWQSPIPASFELKLSEGVQMASRLNVLQQWSVDLRSFVAVEDVFYGQGWIENFSKFIASARGAAISIWILSLSVGLLIVSNCIRLSFLQRKDEIEILELVGATAKFIRTPFLLEGLTIGLVASLISLFLSAAFHTFLLSWLGEHWSFWLAVKGLPPLQVWQVAINLISGLAFGFLGAWNCVRKLNTGWSAAAVT